MYKKIPKTMETNPTMLNMSTEEIAVLGILPDTEKVPRVPILSCNTPPDTYPEPEVEETIRLPWLVQFATMVPSDSPLEIKFGDDFERAIQTLLDVKDTPPAQSGIVNPHVPPDGGV